MNMNGGPSTDPHHHHRPGNYMGLGLGLPPPIPPPGNGVFGGGSSMGSNSAAAAAAAAAGIGMSGGMGSELKHHADFLSRLLAATPSYMNEAGSPPPGFFSDWLRRLVSKPGHGGSGSGGTPVPTTTNSNQSSGSRRSSAGGGMTSPPPSSPQNLGGGLIYSAGGGKSELNGGPEPHPSPNSSSKNRRKRARVSEHGGSHQSHSIANLANKDSSSGSHNHSMLDHTNHSPPFPSPASASLTPTSTPSSGGSTSSAAAAAAAAAALNVNPFTHPLWFFPPFLPNPYMNMGPMSMNVPMSLGGLHPPQPPPTSPFLPTTTPSDNHAHLSPHHFGGPPDFLSGLKSRSNNDSGAVSHAHGVGGGNDPFSKSHSPSGASVVNPASSASKRSRKDNKRKSSCGSGGFSISRLTSPSPSSNSSGGSGICVGGNGRSQAYPLTIEALNRGSDLKKVTQKASGRPSISPTTSNSNGGGKSAGGTAGAGCVDLRVAGRIWERSPPPRSIYKPLSAFHDPSDGNLVHSSPKTDSRSNLSGFKAGRGGGSPSSLSTTYVLSNLTHIYGRVRAAPAPTPPKPPPSKYSALSFLNPATTTPTSDLSEAEGRDSPEFEPFPPIKKAAEENPRDSPIRIPMPRAPAVKQSMSITAGNYKTANGMGTHGEVIDLDLDVETETGSEHEQSQNIPNSRPRAAIEEGAGNLSGSEDDGMEGGDGGGPAEEDEDEDIVNVMSDDPESEDLTPSGCPGALDAH